MGKLTGRPAEDSATGFLSGAGIAGLLAWWRRQLEAVWPAWAPRPFADAIIIEFRGAGLNLSAAPPPGQILYRPPGRPRIAAPLDLSTPQIAPAASDAVILLLPEQLILRRQITLPIAAKDNLRSIIHAEMDRLTPFNAAEVYWGVSQIRRDATRLRLTLHVAPRGRIAALLRHLAAIGLEPSILQDGDGITLARLGNRRRPWAARLGLLAALALGCLLVPLISQQRRLRATEQRLEILLPVQRQITQLQAQIANQAAVQILGRDSILRALALLSAALPDGTWLNDIQVAGDRISFDGQSSNAAQLILALSATPGFQDVSFIAPVTRAPGGADLFSMQLTVTK